MSGMDKSFSVVDKMHIKLGGNFSYSLRIKT